MSRHPALRRFLLVALTVFLGRLLLDLVAPDLPWLAATGVVVVAALAVVAVAERRERSRRPDVTEG